MCVSYFCVFFCCYLTSWLLLLLGEKKSRSLSLECRCLKAMGKNVKFCVRLVCPGNYQDRLLLTVSRRPVVASVPGEHVVSLWSYFKWTFIVKCNRVASAVTIHHDCICLIAWGICISRLKIYSLESPCRRWGFTVSFIIWKRHSDVAVCLLHIPTYFVAWSVCKHPTFQWQSTRELSPVSSYTLTVTTSWFTFYFPLHLVTD